MRNKKLIINLKNSLGSKINKTLKKKMSIGRLSSQMSGHAGTIV